MLNELLDVLGGFQNFILCLIFGMLLVTIGTVIGLNRFHYTGRAIGWYSIFLHSKLRHRIIVSILFVRFFLILMAPFILQQEYMTTIAVYLALSMVAMGLAQKLYYCIYDFLYTILVFSLMYLIYRISAEVHKVQVSFLMRILFGFMALLLLFAAIGQFVIGCYQIAQKEMVRTEDEHKFYLWSIYLLPCFLFVQILPYIVIFHTGYVELLNSAIQYSDGSVKEYPQGSRITESEEGCMISYEDESEMLASSPLYESDGRVVFTSVYSIVRPSLQLSNRINAMDTLELDDNTYYVKQNNNLIEVDNFFLFDGKDIYYFPENTKLAFEDETITLTSFCMVEVKYNQTVTIYNYKRNEQSVYEISNGYCIATMPKRGTINLSTDILYRDNGQEQMLFLQPSLLSNLE